MLKCSKRLINNRGVILIFNKLLGIENININEVKVNHREAVRAVIFKENKILLIHSNLGDYKFPGGGVEEDESHKDALKRELAEETGYINCVIKEKIGVVVERYIDEYDQKVYFQMNSHYYLCELIDQEKVAQQLDDYERVQDYKPKWMTLYDSIIQNEMAIHQLEKNSWINRENYVLKELKNLMNDLSLLGI